MLHRRTPRSLARQQGQGTAGAMIGAKLATQTDLIERVAPGL